MRTTSIEKTRGYGWKAAEWLMGVVGGVALIIGLVIMFGPERDTVGLGGDLAWEIGEISSAWMYGLLIGGVVLIAGVLYMVIAGRSRTRLAPTPMGDLIWHASVFVLVNAYIWAQDFALGSGLDYAHFATIPWGMGLAIHAWNVFRGRATTPTPVVSETLEEEPKTLQPH